MTMTRKLHVSALFGHLQVFFKRTYAPTIYIVRASDGEFSASGLYCVICNFYIYIWRRLHNEELNDLHYSPNIVRVIKMRRMRWAGHVARMGEERGAFRVFVGKPEGKRPLGMGG